MLLAAAPSLLAQAAAQVPTTSAATDEDVIKLDPFSVSASDEGSGYQVKDTLAGSRVRTELRDVGSAITVVNGEMLRDLGAKNQQDLLVYTPSTEIGGVMGNFSGVGDAPTFNETGLLMRPSQNTRVRGLDSADNTRDYFMTEIPWDGYIVDRVDLSRGANSILFGVGSPAGIINTSINTAGFKDSGKVEARMGSFGSYRLSADYNQVVIKKTLSYRIATLLDNTKYRQEYTYNKDRRIFGAVRYEPKIFGEGNKTSIRANLEVGQVRANRPRTLPPNDAVTPFWSRLNGKTFNVYTADTTNPSFSEKFFGRQYNADIVSYRNYDGTVYQNTMGMFSNSYGISATGSRDGGIDYFTSTNSTPRLLAINGMHAYASAKGMEGAGYWKDYTLSDSSVFDFYNKLLDGPNKSENSDWNAFNIAASQTFFDNRLAFELVYDGQRYREANKAILTGGEYYLGVDINERMLDNTVNKNVGRLYVGNSGQYGNSENRIDRDGLRFTTTGELRSEDLFNKGVLTDILGRHVFTGLLSSDQQKTLSKGYLRWASTPEYAQITGGSSSVSDGTRQVEFITYLSDSVVGKSSASGIHANAMNSYFSPGSNLDVKYFDAHWNASSVNPGDVYTYTDYKGVTRTSTQSENPDNYIGWQTKNFSILNSDLGDTADLYTSSGRTTRQVKSRALTWQGYLFGGNIVPTFGWRRDDVYQYTGNSDVTKNANYLANDNYVTERTGKVVGESKSWSLVAHTPAFIRKKLPGNTDFSFFINKGQNFKADSPRADITGAIIPNPDGHTTDYGVAVTTLNDRLTLKVTKYESKVKNATLQGDGAGFSGSLYYTWATPTWLVGQTYNVYRGLSNANTIDQGGFDWFWNYAASDTAHANGMSLGDWLTGHPEWKGPNSTLVQNAAITKTEWDAVSAVLGPKGFLASGYDYQSFFNAYGIPLNAAKLTSSNSADWHSGFQLTNTNSIDFDNNHYINWTQPAYGGKIAKTGSSPVASVDTVSKGYEYELTAQVTKNWNLSVNYVKTTAYRSNLSGTIRKWIEDFSKVMQGPAGDIRIWGGEYWGDSKHTFRETWQNNVLNSYNVFLASEGSSVAELAPWRVNLISNYTFSHGGLKGFNVGAAYRYEPAKAIGYKYSSKLGMLDLNDKIYGKSDDSVDLWFGYEHKLSKKLGFRTQVNLRNVGEKVHLTPVSAQPDGTIAVSRIVEGMTWQWTNTLTF